MMIDGNAVTRPQAVASRRGILGRLLLLLALIGAGSLAHAQGSGVGWDADDSLPPPVGAHGVVRPPLKLKPLHLSLYSDCGTDTCNLPTQFRTLRLELFSTDFLTLFDSWSTDSSMEIRILAQYPFDSTPGSAELRTRRATRQASFNIPQSDFALSVIQGPDTARVTVSRTDRVTVAYVRKSRLLVIDSVRHIPSDLVWTQIHSSDIEAVKSLLAAVEQTFGEECKLTTLRPGYYPCVSPPWIGKVQAGRRKFVNKTAGGFLICYEVLRGDRREEFGRWLSSRQQEFSARFSSEN
jgi:hypothetical protein